MAEEMILQAVNAVWKRKAEYRVRAGVSVKHLQQFGVAYSRTHLYRVLAALERQNKLIRVASRKGYIPVN